MPRIVAAAKASLGKPPKVLVETAIRQNQGAIAFYEAGIYEAGRRDPGAERAEARGRIACCRRSRSIRRSSKRPFCRGRPANGGSARRSSPRKLELELDAGLTADRGARRRRGRIRSASSATCT